MKKLAFIGCALILAGASCSRSLSAPSTQPSPPSATTDAAPSTFKQDFSDRLDDGLKDLEILNDIK